MKALLLVVLIVGAGAVRALLPGGVGATASADAIFVSGVLIVGGWLAGEALRPTRLPRITGYLIFGVAAGPHLLGLVSAQALVEMTRLDELALAVIAFIASGELRLKELRPGLGKLLMLALRATGFLWVLAALGVALIVWLVGRSPGLGATLAVSLLFGVVVLSASPATTIAVLVEARARGPLSRTALGLTILMDVACILLFALALGVAGPVLTPGASLGLAPLLGVLWEVGGSLALGSLLGVLAILYLRHVGSNLPVFALGLAFFTMELAHVSGLHSPLLMGIAAGLVVENLGDEGERFLHGLEQASLPVFMLFFGTSGARLDVPELALTWPFALALIGYRMAAVWAAARVAARGTVALPRVARHVWTGLVAQAGVSLGFLAVIRQSFAGQAWVQSLGAIVGSAVIVNQVLGPALFKLGLIRAGEIADEEDAPPSPPGGAP